MIYFILYVLGAIGFLIYDAKIGFHNFKWDTNEVPPVYIATLGWFLAIPWILIYSFFVWLWKSKEQRLAQEKEQERIRLKTERDLQDAQREVDIEFDPPERKFNYPPIVSDYIIKTCFKECVKKCGQEKMSNDIKYASQEKWEEELEDALAAASPQKVLEIMQKIDGWLAGFCITCGTYNNMYGGKAGCNCLVKGAWND